MRGRSVNGMGGILWLAVGLVVGLIVGWVLRSRSGHGEALAAAADAARVDADRHQATTATLKGDLEKHRARVSELEERVSAVRAEATQAADDKNMAIISGLEGEVGDHRKRAAADAESHAQQVASLKGQIAELRSQLAEPRPAPQPAEPASPAPEAATGSTTFAPLQAVPDEPAASEETAADPQEEGDIHRIEGVGSVYADRLRASGVAWVTTLLERGATESGRSALASETGIDQSRILVWVNHADLMRIDGVDHHMAQLLEAAGVDSSAEMGHRNPSNLAATLAEINRRRNLVESAPDVGTVGAWVARARDLERIVRR